MTTDEGGPSIPDPLARRAATTPDRTALVDAETSQAWRYDELDAAVDGVARRLATLGLSPGDHVGLIAETSVATVRLVHAVWRLGLRLVPVNARLTRSEVAQVAERSDLDVLLCDADAATSAGAVDCPIAVFGADEAVEGLRGGHEPDRDPRALSTLESSPLEPATWEPADVALMPFTSGTTGEPKPVELTMGNLLASATASARRLGVRPDDRWLLCLPVYHVGGLSPVVRCAHYGTGLVVLAGFDPAAVRRATHDHDVTGLSVVPTQLGRLLDVGGAFPDPVRTVLLGGAPAPQALVDRCRDLDVPVHPTYGLTEAASQVATATPEQAFTREGTVGRPLRSVEVTVVDGAGEAVPAGERGEIAIAGPTVTPGYYDDDAATAEAFGPHGLHTGDVGRRDDDGFLWVHGRLDDVIVTGGENVPPGEVEATIRDHPAVAEVAVVGLPDEEWGERVAALVVRATDSGEPDEVALLTHCRERLAGFKVPRTVAFADELPRTASGTVDRPAVRERLAG